MTLKTVKEQSIQNHISLPLNEEESSVQITVPQQPSSKEGNKVAAPSAEIGIVQTQSESALDLASKFSLTLLAGGVLVGGAGLPVSLCVLSLPLLAAAVAGCAGACILGSVMAAIVALAKSGCSAPMIRLQDGKNGTIVPDSGAKLACQEFEVLAIGGQSVLDKLLNVQEQLLQEQRAIKAQSETVLEQTSQLKEAQLKNEAVTEKLTKLPESVEKTVASEFNVKMAALEVKLAELNEKEEEVAANYCMDNEGPAIELEEIKRKFEKTESALTDSENRRAELEKNLSAMTRSLKQDAVAELSSKINALTTSLTTEKKTLASELLGLKGKLDHIASTTPPDHSEALLAKFADLDRRVTALQENLSKVNEMLVKGGATTLPQKFSDLEATLDEVTKGTKPLESELLAIKKMLRQSVLITPSDQPDDLRTKFLQAQSEMLIYKESWEDLKNELSQQKVIETNLTQQVRELQTKFDEAQQKNLDLNRHLAELHSNQVAAASAIAVERTLSDIESRKNSPIIGTDRRGSDDASENSNLAYGPSEESFSEDSSVASGSFEEIQAPTESSHGNGRWDDKIVRLRGPKESDGEDGANIISANRNEIRESGAQPERITVSN